MPPVIPTAPYSEWTVDTPLHELIYEALGAASMCWEHPERAGIFDAEQANAIGEAVMTILRAKQIGLSS